MRRADRLFDIVQKLRGGRLTTARMLADSLEVSERTIYRDVADLQASGVPIEGAAGAGYMMRSGYDLPPLMFSREELVALVAGLRMVRGWGGLAMARAAEDAMTKIEAVLPESRQPQFSAISIHAPAMAMSDDVRRLVDRFEIAAAEGTVMWMSYADGEGKASERHIRPLGLWFWGKVLTVVAWCELRKGFRMFRIDRITEARETQARFTAEEGKTLRDFYALMECARDAYRP